MGKTRRELRDNVFKLLFRVQFFSPEDMEEQINVFLHGGSGGDAGHEFDEDPFGDFFAEEDAEYIRNKCESVIAKIPEIDKSINDNTTGWDTQRMGNAELTILRLAVYEMVYDDDIPVGVAINEAVELAKSYGSSDSGGFVNAVLSNVKNALIPDKE
ncbi:MAG: transcription antitermination factor NusB [Lachnospiraceae bacterium]|nr:transcription antitermination factor NusB [Lachnospiraceae bacterium]